MEGCNFELLALTFYFSDYTDNLPLARLQRRTVDSTVALLVSMIRRLNRSIIGRGGLRRRHSSTFLALYHQHYSQTSNKSIHHAGFTLGIIAC